MPSEGWFLGDVACSAGRKCSGVNDEGVNHLESAQTQTNARTKPNYRKEGAYVNTGAAAWSNTYTGQSVAPGVFSQAQETLLHNLS